MLPGFSRHCVSHVCAVLFSFVCFWMASELVSVQPSTTASFQVSQLHSVDISVSVRIFALIQEVQLQLRLDYHLRMEETLHPY